MAQMTAKAVGRIFWDAGMEWWNDKAPRLGAALAFYTALSLAPILLIVIGISSLVFGEEAAQGQIVAQLRDLVGTEGAKAIEAMLSSSSTSGGVVATVVGIVTLLIGATGVFLQLQDAINTVWELQPKPSVGLWGLFKDRLLSFALLCGLGFLLLVSLLINAGLAAVGTYIGGMLPNWTVVLHAVNFLLAMAVTFGLFAMTFKFLPEAKIAWSDVWIGAAITTVLFVLGKYLIGLYLGKGAVGTAYGAAGSLVVLLLWIYYSSQILLYGAEFTQLYAQRFGWGIVPTAKSEAVTKTEAASNGTVPSDDPQHTLQHSA